MSHAKNGLKMQVLKALQRGWLDPPTISVLVGFFPVRAIYSYLLRLHRWGLLERRRDMRGLLLYRISKRGLERLEWLRGNG
jgi:hypothetical protein